MADVNVNIKSIDNTNAGFASANRNLKRFSNSAKQTTQGLLGTITGAGLGSALGSALGLNLQTIADGVARMITGVSKEAEDALDQIVTSTGRIADITIERMNLRLTKEQLLNNAKKEALRLDKQIAELREAAETKRETSARRTIKVQKATEEQVAAIVKLDEERAEIQLKIDKMKKDAEDSEKARLDRLRETLGQTQDAANQALAPLQGTTLKGREQIEALRASYGRLVYDLTMLEGDESAKGLETRIEKTKELALVATALNAAQIQALEGQRQAAEILGEGFEKAIVNGEKFSDVLKQIGKDLVQLVIRRSITNPLVDAISGFNFASLLGRATGGPVSRGSPYMVGENGPEMFVPTQSGNIVSNERMSAMGGSTYYIDARGADRSGFARLEQMIQQTQASIQPIALQSVVSASARGMI
jgi:hypothetical protein